MRMSTTDNNFQEEQVALSSGVSMKVQWASPAKAQQPPLIFLHGSFHGGWCWTERFFEYFVARGYPVAAVNWRGTGGTFAGEGVKKVKMEEHVQDLKAFLEGFVPKHFQSSNGKPILVSHSFGGLSILGGVSRKSLRVGRCRDNVLGSTQRQWPNDHEVSKAFLTGQLEDHGRVSDEKGYQRFQPLPGSILWRHRG